MNNKLLDLSQRFKEGSNEFYILNHKEHKRSIYFRNNKKAIKFIRRKFHNKNKIIYFLIKIRVLQPFLKKIKLSKKMGDVIFIANEIKCFDLNKNIVVSLPHNLSKSYFIGEKKFQIKLSKKNLAPKIFKLDENLVFSEEELLEEYHGDLKIPLKKLGLFHQDLFDKNGNLIKEHILKKGDSCVFIDWGIPKR